MEFTFDSLIPVEKIETSVPVVEEAAVNKAGE